MKASQKAILVTVGLVVVLLVVALVYVLLSENRASAPETEGNDGPQVVRENSHVLDDGGDAAVTVVEFLDFECEACGAFYPLVEDLREKFDGEITYVIRYFPLPGHFNSKNAAIAAEAAAQQGRLEDMYHRLFQTQAQWGEAQESRANLFRGFAVELGLDMAAFDEAVADPATAQRVEFDVDEGERLGVSSTPTFFIDGEQVVLEKWTDLEDGIEAAVNGTQ
ncbi:MULTISPECIES: thioredoxin domain-containing protein [Microbacterium]|jgi:protein-disulfide isomerase|uniref:DsbA family protein n=1 Tax=Microbacterium TaxID=33882 RepID=UPI000493AD76|nr:MULTISPECIES: thioredoxin domain-containing protein [Microbacterium]AVL96126.1 disulfide bond formation protein DsbA [Microbacterium sp. str. 'China']KYJ98088.1 disulfide bond formation protein DsbA [Microbacterium sp. CH1]MCT1394415.1 DsbA family protein [Microbacterium sp. p3-SID338]MDH5131984.1 thioredoxin domain-containing protein [Microbacterium sp. RD10]MDH5135753.1 thioredoxin domain-containing protein [Microbacterium sp. RD11]